MPAPVAVGHYKLLAEIGAGGMGEVFRAQDTVLGRTVAVKRLKPEVLADPQRRARFLQEARATSALEHPNIVTIHDLVQQDGIDFLVMEYVAGETLKQVLAGGPLPVRRALPIAVQIAAALEAAHHGGVVHRDLKPSNVMVTPTGSVKVLDFGLAKIIPAPIQQDQPTATAPPNQTSGGVVLGTAAYMSPEQAEGAKVDQRSDIFSFGAVLYEMITGRQAFSGKSWSSTIAAILAREPPAIETSGAITPELDSLIRLCLKKDPQRRFQHMDDVKVALQQLIETPLLPEKPARRRRSAVLVGAGLLLAATAAAGAWWWRGNIAGPPGWQDARLTQLTRDTGLTTNPHFSADGKLLVYASDRAEPGNLDIWVQQADGGSAVRLTTDAAADHMPKLFPSGTQIVFRSERAGGGLYLMPALGGPARLLAPQGRQAAVSPDGQLIAYNLAAPGDSRRSQLYVIPAEGGAPKRLAAGFVTAGGAIWSPDSKHILFIGTGPGERVDWWLTTPEDAEPVQTYTLYPHESRKVGLGAPDAWSPDGNWIYTTGVRGDSPNIWRLRWDAAAHRTGQAERVTFGTGEVQVTVAQQSIAFFSGRQAASIWSIPLDADRGIVSGPPERLTAGVTGQLRSDLSADGNTIAFLSLQSGQPDIWIRHLPTGVERSVTSNTMMENQPKFSRDARQLAYMVIEDGKYAIYTISVDGGVASKVCDDCGWPLNWTNDNSSILFQKGPLPEASIWLLPLNTRIARPVIREPGRPLWTARLSPDGGWITFKEDIDLNRTRIYAAPVLPSQPTPRDQWIPITSGNTWDDLPRWSPNGQLLYFLSRRDGMNCFWAVRLNPVTRQPQGEPFAAFHLHQIRLMTMPDIRFMELAVGPGRLVFPGYEVTGNLWLVRPD